MIDLSVLNGAAVETFNQSIARSRNGGGAGTPTHIYDELLPSAAFKREENLEGAFRVEASRARIGCIGGAEA